MLTGYYEDERSWVGRRQGVRPTSPSEASPTAILQDTHSVEGQEPSRGLRSDGRADSERIELPLLVRRAMLVGSHLPGAGR
jgi:hypothetical protein